MDVGKAFTFVTQDEGWVRKLAIWFALSLFSFLIIPIPFMIGYMVAIMRNVADNVEKPLPEWEDWGRFFNDGLALIAAQIVYTLPLWVLACAASVSTVVVGNLSDIGEEVATAGYLATFGLIGCLSLLLVVVLLFLGPAIAVQYVINNSLRATFRVGEVVAIARDHIGDILVTFLATLGAWFAVSVIVIALNIIPCLGTIAGFLVSFAAGPYIMAATGHLYGQITARTGGKSIKPA